MAILVPSKALVDQTRGRQRSACPAKSSPSGSPAASMIHSECELRVMEVLRKLPRLTFSQLTRATGLEGEELRLALDALSKKGLVVRLETVITSYSCALAGPTA
jgi:DNA-binding HxlR family transcriptional regulator